MKQFKIHLILFIGLISFFLYAKEITKPKQLLLPAKKTDVMQKEELSLAEEKREKPRLALEKDEQKKEMLMAKNKKVEGKKEEMRLATQEAAKQKNEIRLETVNQAEEKRKEPMRLALEKTEQQKEKQKERIVMLNNKITAQTITYDKHWYKPSPSDFEVSVNDQKFITLKNGQPVQHKSKIAVIKNKVKVTYEWAFNKFGKLWHKEKKELEFILQPDQDEVNLAFCWDDDNRINIDKANMILCSNLEQTTNK